MTSMRRRGDRVRITTGKYAGRTGIVESNVFQKTVDYPTELSNGFQVMLDSDELSSYGGIRWSQPCSLRPLGMRCWQPAKVGHELSSFALCQDDDKTYS